MRKREGDKAIAAGAERVPAAVKEARGPREIQVAWDKFAKRFSRIQNSEEGTG